MNLTYLHDLKSLSQLIIRKFMTNLRKKQQNSHVRGDVRLFLANYNVADFACICHMERRSKISIFDDLGYISIRNYCMIIA